MRVRSKKLGYYGMKLRPEGEEFDIEGYTNQDGVEIPVERVFSRRWMEKVEPSKKVSKSKAKVSNEEADAQAEDVI